jgi:alpha-tubulin suppressor-like RCC1 family protein
MPLSPSLLPQLHVFLAVARRSFSAAARELNVSASSVSQAVRQFEEQLRVVARFRSLEACARRRRARPPALSWRWRVLVVVAFPACSDRGAELGGNDSGVIGDGPVEKGAQREPGEHVEPLTAVAVSIGASAACALTAAGAVVCWGCNQNGVLGNDSLVSSAVPVPIGGLSSSPISLSVGTNSACAASASGEVECWGDIVAASDGGSSALTMTIAGFSGAVIAVSVGDGSACGLTASGEVECWGVQLGGYSYLATPSPVAGLPSGVTSVSVGFDSACAVTAGGGVECWGGNDFGQLGNDSTAASAAPVPVTGLESGVEAISVGQQSACALTTGGQIECWGALMQNIGGATATIPQAVSGLASGVTAVSVGTQSACALRAGSVESWGNDTRDGVVPTYPPVTVPDLGSAAIAVSVGAASACAIADGGGVVCWGAAQCESLGEAAYSAVPIPVPGLVGDP